MDPLSYIPPECVLIWIAENTEGPAWFVMSNMCVNLTEIYNIDGGSEKDVSSLEGTT